MGGAAQLNKARVPQRSCGFALPADAVLALVLNLNLGLLAKLCVCIPFLPGKRAAILILETPAERDDRFCLRPPKTGQYGLAGGWTSHDLGFFFSHRLVFSRLFLLSSCVDGGDPASPSLGEKGWPHSFGQCWLRRRDRSKRQLRRPAFPAS